MIEVPLSKIPWLLEMDGCSITYVHLFIVYHRSLSVHPDPKRTYGQDKHQQLSVRTKG